MPHIDKRHYPNHGNRLTTYELKIPSSKIRQIKDFIHECIVKEFTSCIRHLWYRMVFWFNPCKNGLNKKNIRKTNQGNHTAKIVLLIHGDGAHESSFIPMAKKLSHAEIKNIFTVDLQLSDKNKMCTNTLKTRIDEITEKFLNKGYSNVDFILVGHSLGALVGSKYIWRDKHQIKCCKVSMIISIAGRLRYIPNKFSWLCEDIKLEIEKTFHAISKDPKKALLYGIWGNKDAVVPELSVHIQKIPSKEYTVNNWGHGGIIFAPDTHEQVISWIQRYTTPTCKINF